MPVTTHSYAHFQAPAGNPPAAPVTVTSVTRDAGATISFRPGAAGDAPVSAWLVTPYIAGSAQSPQAVGTGSATTIAASDSNTYTQVPVTGLSNGTAYTFTVRGVSAAGTGAESAASGANTPLQYLVFGDDFNGPAGAFPDPEWWVYNPRCGFLAQSEVQYYLGDHCVLDGSGNLQLTAEHTSYTGPSYPSAGGGSVTQPWRSGACQSNTRTFVPAAGNTMTFEARQQVCPDAGGTMWPGLLWLAGQDYLDAWKTDPAQPGWDATGKAEIDVAEWNQTGSPDSIGNNVMTSQWHSYSASVSGGATSMHTYQARWKPSVSVTWLRDGSQVNQCTADIPTSGCHFFLLLYLQIHSGTASSPQSCYIDWVRVFDQDLG